MIQTIKGNLFSAAEGYIVHGCNAQCVMGSGVAKIVKSQYFDAFKVYAEDYASKANANSSTLGTNTYADFDDFTIVNAVTQDYYGTDKQHTDYDALRNCFRSLAVYIIEKNKSHVVNFPLIGCGLGGGDWEIVEQIIEDELDDTFKKCLWIL